MTLLLDSSSSVFGAQPAQHTPLAVPSEVSTAWSPFICLTGVQGDLAYPTII